MGEAAGKHCPAAIADSFPHGQPPCLAPQETQKPRDIAVSTKRQDWQWEVKEGVSM